MSERSEGKVHFLWVIIAVLGTALVVVLGAVAYNLSQKPLTPEELEREKIILFVADKVYASARQAGGTYGTALEIVRSDARKMSLKRLRQYATEEYGYPPSD